MVKITHKRLLSLFLIFLLLVTWWLDNRISEESIESDNPGIPDVSMNDFSAIKFDPKGSIEYKLNGNKFTYFKRKDTSFLDMPILEYIDKNNVTSRFQSKKAYVDNRKDFILLEDNVSLKKSSKSNGEELGIFTEKLKINTISELITSEDAVIIFKKNSKLTSIGFEYDNKNKILKLKKNVKAYYENSRVKK